MAEIALERRDRHLDVELPTTTWSVARIRRRIGATSRLAKDSPSQIAESSMVSASSTYTVAKASSRLWRCASNRVVERGDVGRVLGETFAANGSMRARRIEELSSDAGNRAEPTKVVAVAEEAAERLPARGVLEIGRFGPGDLRARPSLDASRRRAVALHQRRGAEAERLDARGEIVGELRRDRRVAAARCVRCRRR